MGTECMLSRSIFPYDIVTMGRVDHVNRTQVLLDMQYEADEDEPLRIPRPLVIPRNRNDTIVTENFTLQCSGKVGANVLEDEMYMSEILMMAEDIKLPWYKLPLDEVPSLNILWEYGTCYPLVRYITAPSSSSSHKHALVFLHPSRFSMMVWVPPQDQMDDEADMVSPNMFIGTG